MNLLLCSTNASHREPAGYTLPHPIKASITKLLIFVTAFGVWRLLLFQDVLARAVCSFGDCLKSPVLLIRYQFWPIFLLYLKDLSSLSFILYTLTLYFYFSPPAFTCRQRKRPEKKKACPLMRSLKPRLRARDRIQ